MTLSFFASMTAAPSDFRKIEGLLMREIHTMIHCLMY